MSPPSVTEKDETVAKTSDQSDSSRLKILHCYSVEDPAYWPCLRSILLHEETAWNILMIIAFSINRDVHRLVIIIMHRLVGSYLDSIYTLKIIL